MSWKRSWTLQDLSNSSPEQDNTYDCGVFTVINITLLAQRFQLTRQIYTSDTISFQNTRQRIAYLSGRNPEINRRCRDHGLDSVDPHPTSQRKTAQPTKSWPPVKRSIATAMKANCRKKYRNQIIFLGEWRIQSASLSRTRHHSR